MAASDLIEMVKAPSEVELRNQEAALKRDSLPTIREVQQSATRLLRQIPARGRIRSDDEFELVSALVSDMGSARLSDEQGMRASNLMGQDEMGSWAFNLTTRSSGRSDCARLPTSY